MLWKIKKPCEHCPFRRDVHPFLDRRFAQMLATKLSNDQNWFACHETTRITKSRRVRPAKQSHCIGAAIVLYRSGLINIATRIALYGRLITDADLNITVPSVFDTLEEFLAHHCKGRMC